MSAAGWLASALACGVCLVAGVGLYLRLIFRTTEDGRIRPGEDR